jgi:replicative DNA helicase
MVRERRFCGLINVSTEVIAECYEHTEDVEELLDRAERLIFEISEQRVNAAFTNLKELLKDSIRYTEQLYERHELITGLPSGFRDFDQITAGLQPSDLIIVAARPGMGKRLRAQHRRNVGTHARPAPSGSRFSLEMSKSSWRYACCVLGRGSTQPSSPWISDKQE